MAIEPIIKFENDSNSNVRTRRGEAKAWLAANIEFSGPGCLIWPYQRNADGYALFQNRGGSKLVSRYVCQRRRGPPPTPKHEAAHSCGKGHDGCINGEHLHWATRKENVAESLNHGTHIRGEKHRNSKLTEARVLIIRAYPSTMTLQQMADLENVSFSLISQVRRRKVWAWL